MRELRFLTVVPGLSLIHSGLMTEIMDRLQKVPGGLERVVKHNQGSFCCAAQWGWVGWSTGCNSHHAL